MYDILGQEGMTTVRSTGRPDVRPHSTAPAITDSGIRSIRPRQGCFVSGSRAQSYPASFRRLPLVSNLWNKLVARPPGPVISKGLQSAANRIWKSGL